MMTDNLTIIYDYVIYPPKERIIAKPDTFWLVKSGQHRQIKVVSDAELDDNSLKGKKEKFIQKMVSPPMLVSGRKFDIGTYVVVTSGEPFRFGLEMTNHRHIDDVIIPKNSFQPL